MNGPTMVLLIIPSQIIRFLEPCCCRNIRWLLSPLSPLLPVHWWIKHVCFISNVMYFHVHLTIIFQAFQVSSWSNFASFCSRHEVQSLQKSVCSPSQDSRVNCTGFDVDPLPSPSSKHLCHSVFSYVHDFPNKVKQSSHGSLIFWRQILGLYRNVLYS